MRKLTLVMAFSSALAAGCSKKSASESGSSPVSANNNDATASPTPSSSPTPTPTTTTSGGTTGAEAATAFTFTNAALQLADGACGALNLQATGAGGVATQVVNTHPLHLSSSSATAKFFSDSACADDIVSVTFLPGSEAATLYFSDTATGTPTAVATDSATPPLTAATQTETVGGTATGTGSGTTATTTASGTTAGPATTLAFLNSPLAQDIHTCGVLSIGIQDGNGHNVPTTTALDLLLTTTAGAFFSDGKCTVAVSELTIAATTATGSVFFADTALATGTVTATPPATSKLASASQAFTVEGSLTISSGTNLSSNVCEGLNVDLPTAQTADILITLKTSSATGAFYASNTCTTPITTYNVGSGDTAFTVFYKETGHVVTDTLTLSPPATVNFAPTIGQFTFL